MSRPRFLADQNLADAIVQGVVRRQPAVVFDRLRDFDLERLSDDEVLAFAAQDGYAVVSHDVHSMTAAAWDRMDSGKPMLGLLLVKQRHAARSILESLLFLWSEGTAEDLIGQIEYLPL